MSLWKMNKSFCIFPFNIISEVNSFNIEAICTLHLNKRKEITNICNFVLWNFYFHEVQYKKFDKELKKIIY